MPTCCWCNILKLSETDIFSPGVIEAALFSTAKDLGTSGKDIYYGYGLVNAYEMIKSRAINRPFLELLKQYPNMFPILQLLLQRLGM